jgi:hypothetical protein
MINRKIILFIFFILLPFLIFSTATAGGVSWLFQIKDFREVKTGKHIIVLKPLEFGKEFPLNCDVITVHSQYQTFYWLFVWDKEGISKENHKKALSLIKESFVSQLPVRFGSMGEGFGFEGNKSSCEVYSRALTISEVNGGKEIYSYYKWP